MSLHKYDGGRESILDVIIQFACRRVPIVARAFGDLPLAATLCAPLRTTGFCFQGRERRSRLL